MNLRLAILLLHLPLAPAFAGDSPAASGKTDLPYDETPAAPPERRLDISAPPLAKSSQRPVVMLIHGGAWAFGDKSAGFAQPKTEWFLRHGFVVVSMNYRLSPAVRHPAHIEDVAMALAWVRRHAPEYGGDPDRIVLLGHSAGAHLAALAAVDHPRLAAAGVPTDCLKGVILLDGAGYDVPRQIADAGPLLRRRYRDAFGTDLAAQRDASPTLKITETAKYPPFLIFHVPSREDSRRQSESLAAALTHAGAKATVVAAGPAETHMSLNRQFGLENDPETIRTEAELRDWRLLAAPGQ